MSFIVTFAKLSSGLLENGLNLLLAGWFGNVQMSVETLHLGCFIKIASIQPDHGSCDVIHHQTTCSMWDLHDSRDLLIGRGGLRTVVTKQGCTSLLHHVTDQFRCSVKWGIRIFLCCLHGTGDDSNGFGRGNKIPETIRCQNHKAIVPRDLMDLHIGLCSNVGWCVGFLEPFGGIRHKIIPKMTLVDAITEGTSWFEHALHTTQGVHIVFVGMFGAQTLAFLLDVGAVNLRHRDRGPHLVCAFVLLRVAAHHRTAVSGVGHVGVPVLDVGHHRTGAAEPTTVLVRDGRTLQVDVVRLQEGVLQTVGNDSLRRGVLVVVVIRDHSIGASTVIRCGSDLCRGALVVLVGGVFGLTAGAVREQHCEEALGVGDVVEELLGQEVGSTCASVAVVHAEESTRGDALVGIRRQDHLSSCVLHRAVGLEGVHVEPTHHTLWHRKVDTAFGGAQLQLDLLQWKVQLYTHSVR
mmetsp:Transcript_53435/g.134266  ORF Transcript_53435/g.134266 Transcript_53435/m.134266 type:complete len:464 (-) Transcript_53435:470-1861(-)